MRVALTSPSSVPPALSQTPNSAPSSALSSLSRLVVIKLIHHRKSRSFICMDVGVSKRHCSKVSS
uniref:Uncharacterized protein n=1 Tax=Anguilla anguilla TaxID=7936 RepID=A0A0E9UKC9_ANGAN